MRKEDQWNKQGTHEISGDGSCEISAFKLPCTDQDTERRNFPGYKTYSPGEDLMRAVSEEGTTETRGGSKTNQEVKHNSTHLERRFK